MAAANHGRNKVLFDIGCGAGLITSLVYDHAKDVSVISLDSDPGMMSEVKRKSMMGDWDGWKGITADFYVSQDTWPYIWRPLIERRTTA